MRDDGSGALMAEFERLAAGGEPPVTTTQNAYQHVGGLRCEDVDATASGLIQFLDAIDPRIMDTYLDMLNRPEK